MVGPIQERVMKLTLQIDQGRILFPQVDVAHYKIPTDVQCKLSMRLMRGKLTHTVQHMPVINFFSKHTLDV